MVGRCQGLFAYAHKDEPPNTLEDLVPHAPHVYPHEPSRVFKSRHGLCKEDIYLMWVLRYSPLNMDLVKYAVQVSRETRVKKRRLPLFGLTYSAKKMRASRLGKCPKCAREIDACLTFRTYRNCAKRGMFSTNRSLWLAWIKEGMNFLQGPNYEPKSIVDEHVQHELMRVRVDPRLYFDHLEGWTTTDDEDEAQGNLVYDLDDLDDFYGF
jgi:hypothetical protein